MDNWFRSKWFVRAISLAFAILLFIFVSLDINDDKSQNDLRFTAPSDSNDVETIENVPVKIRIDEDRYVVSGVPETVKVSLEGSPGILTPITRQQNFDVYVDLKDLGPGQHTVDIKHSGLPQDLNVYIEPKTIDVIMEERSSEEFSVDVDFINTDKLPEGYEIGSSEVEPKTVKITSSKEVIDRIGIVKVYVDVAGLKESIEAREVPVNVYDSQGNSLEVNVEPKSVVVSAELLNPSKKVPLAVPTKGELPEDFALSSIKANVDEVEVFATNAILESIDKVKTEEIDLSDVTESKTIETTLSLPEGVSVPKTDTVKVEIELERTRTVDDVAIDVKNLADGQDIAFNNPDDSTMAVTVAGSEKSISNLKAEDIQIFIDAKGLEEGEHKVPIVIKGPEDVTVTAELKEATIEIS